ncbi:MAG: hypothetical protein MJZ69_05670 [Bacteroidaceae bacterium]|nr:hypothetical protein [Bacteroidaceae bacterium]
MIRKLLLFIAFLPLMASAQEDAYCGEHAFDGVHKNEVQGYATLGENTKFKTFVALSGTYTRHLTEFLDMQGSLTYQSGNKHFGVAAEGRYRMPIGRANLYATARFLFNRYGAYEQNETNYNFGLSWEARYWDIRVGVYQTTFSGYGSSYTEPISMQFGIAGYIRPRENKWNVGFFFRNFDDFYYEHWNINWGFAWKARLSQRINLFGQIDVRPAGSMSQIASKYESHLKIGLKYVW